MRQSMKYFILFYGAFETFVFTGNIFGWSSLLHMLRHEGIYEYVCQKPSELSTLLSTFPAGNLQSETMELQNVQNVSVLRMREKSPIRCAEQDRILNLAYTIGSFCIGISSFIWGFLLDKWGLRIVRLIINGLVTLGCVLLSLTVKKTSYLLFPSLILMCVVGVPLRMANMQIADLFPEQRATIITAYSGAFTASASVFVFVKYGYDAGLPWEWACFILVCLSVFMLPVTLFILPADRIREPPEPGMFQPAVNEVDTVAPVVLGTYNSNSVSPELKKKSDSSLGSLNKDSKANSKLVYGEKKIDKPKSWTEPQQSELDEENRDAERKRREPQGEKSEPKTKSDMVSEKSDVNTKSAEKNSMEERDLPLILSLKSFSFFMHQYWFCWLLLYTIIYVGTLHLWVGRTSAEHDNSAWFSEVFGLSQVAGLFLAPIGGIFMDWNTRKALEEPDSESRKLGVLRSCFWPMFLTTMTEAAAQICKFYNLEVAIYVSIVAVTLLRAFFIAIGTAYLRIRFPGYHFNKLLGVMSTMSALVTLLQFPLFLWETSSSQGVLQVNIFEAVCLAIAFIHPLLMLVTPFQEYLFRKEKAARERLHSQECPDD